LLFKKYFISLQKNKNMKTFKQFNESIEEDENDNEKVIIMLSTME
jgi:hypothetical protein